jgi:hypothetical protein
MAARAETGFAGAEAVRADACEAGDGGKQEEGSEGEDDGAGREGFGCVEGAAFGGVWTDLNG